MFRSATILTTGTVTAVLLALTEPLVAASGIGKIIITGALLALFRSPLWMTALLSGKDGGT